MLLSAALAIGLAWPTTAPAATATATLDRAEIPLGSTAHLGVTVQGAAMVQTPQPPAVDGLLFRYAGQQMSFQIINGAMSGSATHSYEVTPQRAGDFHIPEITLQAGKETLRTAALRLKVSGPAAPPPAPAAPPSAPSTPPPDAAGNQAAMLQLLVPPREVYVGEVVPVQARLFLHPNLRVREVSLPSLGGDAFAVAPVPRNPAQTTESVNGLPYNVLTWGTTATAVKAGEHPLAGQVQLVVLQRAQNRARDVFGGALLDNPLFEEFFGGVEAKTASLATKPTTVKVLPLPAEGRPESFSGAVGRFELEAEADPRQVLAGDPVTLRFTLRGSGNLDRLQPPRLADSPSWKTYPPSLRPPPTGQPADAARRTFEQAVIPLDASVAAVPSVPWSYFDPEARRYVTLAAPSIPLKVQPPAAAAAPNPAPIPAAAPGPSDEERALAGAGSWTRKAAGRLLLLAQKPSFWLALLAPLAGVAAGRGAWRAIQRRRQDPLHLRRLAASRAVRKALVQMDAAQRAVDSPAFFAAASRALREQLAARFHLNAASLVLRDAEPFLEHDRALLGEIRELFEAADAASFAGAASDPAALAQWRTRVEGCLGRIKAP
jgi:hypothetical protein